MITCAQMEAVRQYLDDEIQSHLKHFGEYRLTVDKFRTALHLASVRLVGPSEAKAIGRAVAVVDLIKCAEAVLDLVEQEGRDTGLGGPFSDLRDAVEAAKK